MENNPPQPEMTDEQILELAKTCEIDFSIKWRHKGGESSNQMYWECWEEQLLKFAWEIYGIAADETLQDYESKF